jgi:hypothetical protein
VIDAYRRDRRFKKQKGKMFISGIEPTSLRLVLVIGKSPDYSQAGLDNVRRRVSTRESNFLPRTRNLQTVRDYSLNREPESRTLRLDLVKSHTLYRFFEKSQSRSLEMEGEPYELPRQLHG